MALSSNVKVINKKDRTVEFEDGRVVPLPDDLALELLGSEAAQEKKKGFKEATLGVNQPLGATGAYLAGAADENALSSLASQFLDYPGESVSSFQKGKGQEEMSFLERLSENVAAKRSGRREALQQTEAEHPVAYKAGQATGFGLDLLFPWGRVAKGVLKAPSAVKEGALIGSVFGAGSSDKSVLNDPAGVAKDVAIGAGLGAAGGKIGEKLESVAKQRQAIRQRPAAVAANAEAQAKNAQEYLSKMDTKLQAIQPELKSGGIPKSVLSTEEFVNQNIGLSPMSGSTEGNRLSAFIRGLEAAAPENMNASEIRKLFGAVEGKLATASAEEATVLNNFRQHMVDYLPIGAAQAAVKQRYGQRVLQSFDQAVDKGLKDFLSDKKMVSELERWVGKGTTANLAQDIKRFAKSGIDKMSPKEFVDSLNNGQLENNLLWRMENSQKFKTLIERIEDVSGAAHPNAAYNVPQRMKADAISKAVSELQKMRQNVGEELAKKIQSNVYSSTIYNRDVASKVAEKLSDATGIPTSTAPGFAPSNQRAAPLPPVPEANAGRMASFFEKPNFYGSMFKKAATLKGTSGGAKLGYGLAAAATGLPVAKTAAVVGGTGLGLTAALRGVTSPGALASVARQGIQRGSLRGIVDSIAETYPSYYNGVLMDPQDRRMAAAQVEQDQDLGIEDKAVLQAKINRGISLETLIRDEE
jgi:hypothetical protein